MTKNKIIKYLPFFLIIIVLSPNLLFVVSNSVDGINRSNIEDITYSDKTINEELLNNTCELSKRDFLSLNNSNNIKSQNYFKKQDISLIPEYKAAVCLGKIIQVQKYFNYNNVFFGTNLWFSILYISFGCISILILSYFLKLKLTLIIVNLFIFSFSFQLNFQEYLYFSDIISRVLPFLVLYVFLNKPLLESLKISTDKLYYAKQTNSFSSGLLTKNLYQYVFLTFLPIIHFLTGRKVLPDNYLFNDVATNLLTADKMTHFKMSNFQATWNHHSNLIPELYSLNSLFGFESSVDSLFLLQSIILYPVSIIFYHLLLKLDIEKWNSVFYVSIFIFEFSHYALLNRHIGFYINLGILFFAISYLESKKNVYLVFYTFFSCLQFFNLESFSISILSIYLLILFFEDKRSNLIFKTFISVSASLFIIYFPIFLDGELETLFKTNYIFHLFNTTTLGLSNTSRFIQIFEALYYPGNRGINQYFLLHIFSFSCIFRKYKESIKIKDYQSLILFNLFIGEFLHLLITGPRFNHYGSLLLLPSYLIFLNFINKSLKRLKILERKKLYVNSLILILFLSPLSITLLKERVFQSNFYPTPLTAVPYELIEDKEKNTIHNIIKNNGEPDLILTWVHPMDWYWVHFESNTLPSSRFWIWLRMRYVDTGRYTWDGFDEKEMIEQFFEDIDTENPKYILIDSTYYEIPFFFNDLFLSDYNEIFKGDKYTLYENN